MNKEKKETLENFVDLMSKGKISDSDLELVTLANKLGLDLVSFKELRESQGDKFANEIRELALEKLGQKDDNVLEKDDLFYAGSIDFMVCEQPDGKKYFLLETNGGSNRGLSIITEKQQKIMYEGYYEAIRQAIERNDRGDNKILILVGVPINDGLIHEKVIMLEYFRKKLEQKGKSVKIYNVQNFKNDFECDVAFVIADYEQLSTRVSFNQNWVRFQDEPINVLIGDGIARRIENNEFHEIIVNDFRKLNSIIVNPIFKITDDKSLTYLASYFARETVENYNLKYLLFSKAFDEQDLINKLTHIVENYERPFIIKPNGGSGGAGVIPISPDENPANIKSIIEQSKKEFYAKFMKNRNPYPYTIQEMAEFCLIDWMGGLHTFDIRIYMAQKAGQIIPIGGLARIARGSYSGSLDKQEFVVNLSGYDGDIEVQRGRGFSEENAKLLNLSKENLTDIFCIGCALFASMAKNYKKIITFDEWEDLIGE
ncbi:MAG: hypothetical protein ACOC4M_00950 [Promethearchaeia archaeon]